MLKHRRTGSVNSGAVALALLLSLSVNAVLAVRIFRHHPTPTLQTETHPIRAPFPNVPAEPPAANTIPNVLTTNAAPPFQWSQIESADYRQYIANLRAVGCPEEIIRDIIMADLNQAYSPRAAEIWKPKPHPYWQKRTNDQPSAEQQKKLQALSQEKTEIYKELFGVRLHDQSLVDTIFLQTHGSEGELAFLPDDRKQAALEALANSGFDEKELKQLETGDYWHQREELFEEKLKLLSNALSPSEVEEFKARNSQVANNLRSELRYFDLTPEEFKLLLVARENDPQKGGAGNLLDRSTATEEVRKLFGDERAKTFEQVSDMFYINARRAAEDHGLDLEGAEQAWQATHDARAEAELAAADPALSPEQRTNRVMAIERQTEKRLTDVLGENASLPLRNDLRTVLATVWHNPAK
jgi:hypothetical protein